MAISGYSSYKTQRRKIVIYYAVIIIIVIAGAFLLFNPFSAKTPEPIQNQPAQPVMPPEVLNAPAAIKLPEAETEPDYNKIISDANGLVGTRVMALLKDAQNSIESERIIAARDTLGNVLNMSLTPALRDNIKKQMTVLSDEWLFNKTAFLGDNLCTTYKVQPGDILSEIARRYKVPYQFIMRINNISSERALRSGQILKVVNGPFHAIVYRSSFNMDLYLRNVYIKTYAVGIGKEGKETPVGLWRVKIGGKLIKPTWTDPETGRTYHAEDPNYPLGSGWIGLEGIDSRTRSIEGIAIHGTKDETSIGTKSSRGCVRLYNGELIELFDILEPGFSELRIVD